MKNDKERSLKERVLGHILSREDLAKVLSSEDIDRISGGADPIPTLPPVNCSPKTDPSTPTKPAPGA